MIKKNLIIVLFLFSSFCVGQSNEYNLKVTYEMQTYFSGLTSYDANLYINEAEAIFKYKNLDEDGIADKGDNNFTFKVADSTLFFIQSSKHNDSIVELKKGIEKGKFYIIKEHFPKIDWTITTDTTKISNHICYKATAEFRGRSYTAWFAPSIATTFGPWKLHGLPGLILTAYDSKKEVFFTAKKIQTVHYPVTTSNIGNIEIVSSKEYKQILKKGIQDLGEKLSSKAERGFTITVSTSSVKAIEIDD